MQVGSFPESEVLLDYKSAAELLNISPHSLRNHVRDKRIGFVRVGRLIRIPRSAIVEYIEANTVPARRPA